MINYSFSTVYMAVITSNLILILITLFFQNTKIMVNAGYKLLALFIGLTVLRFALPFEFPFTTTILLTDFETLSCLIAYIRRTLFMICGYKVSIWTFLQVIWLVGIFINVIRYINEHKTTKYFILANSLDVTTDEPYFSLLNRICGERHKKNSFRVLTVTGIDNPMLYGIVSPCILIPEDMELSPNDLYYCFAHEASHHFHGDLLIKKIIRIISIIYWWNPVCYILIHKLNILLEMRVDDVVTASGKEEIQKYLHCLLQISERATEENTFSRSVAMAFQPGDNGELTQRFLMLLSNGQRKKRMLNVLLFTVVISIYASSHLFIFEAHYIPKEIQATTLGQTTDNSYAILKEDGTYDVYFNEYFIENVDSLEYYIADIPIYTENEVTN